MYDSIRTWKKYPKWGSCCGTACRHDSLPGTLERGCKEASHSLLDTQLRVANRHVQVQKVSETHAVQEDIQYSQRDPTRPFQIDDVQYN